MKTTQFTEAVLKSTLQQQFGYSEFRVGQLEAIQLLLEQNRSLCIQPTGYGKSLIYQLPAVLLSGITLVISPLLALMRDQLLHLKTRFHIPAVSINTDQSEEENAAAKRAILKGEVKILFISPEQLDHIDRFNFFLQLPIELIVVDEVHCISTWGHDFRPSYRQIAQFIKKFEQQNIFIRILGLTATANAAAEHDIKQQLDNAQQPLLVHRTSMLRDNIALSVVPAPNFSLKLALLLQLLKELPAGGIIYCSTRDNTELVAEYLQSQQIKAVAYHAGLASDQKRVIQQAFISNKFQVITATNALGMGIDKSDLRFIIHFDIPGSITAYYQEVGRCGRDGKPAYGILLYDPVDKKVQQYFIDSAEPKLGDFQTILSILANSKEPLGLIKIKQLSGLHPTRVTVVMSELSEQGFLQKESVDGKQVYRLIKNSNTPDLSRYNNQNKVKLNGLSAMLAYAEKSKMCRMNTLCNALGDQVEIHCGVCDICKPGPFVFQEAPSQAIETWVNSRVVKIESSKIPVMSEGIALLDGKQRSALFSDFMRRRALPDQSDFGIADELKTILLAQLQDIINQQGVQTIIMMPSFTWQSRELVAKWLAEQLKIPVFLELLQWLDKPQARQGELLNNDQRRMNVANQMTLSTQVLPAGNVLLFDDYVGSGATFKEAARALQKKSGKSISIVPFAIAAVTWKLGQRGMI